MYEAVTGREAADQQDIIIKAAAVADYRHAAIAERKIKSGDLSLPGRMTSAWRTGWAATGRPVKTASS